jgi:hypothetical protein
MYYSGIALNEGIYLFVFAILQLALKIKTGYKTIRKKV